MHLNLADLPDDPIRRVVALLQLEQEVEAELTEAYAEAYFDARLANLLEPVAAIKRHPRRQILKFTRRQNEKRGRQVRWSDAADPTSTAYGSGAR